MARLVVLMEYPFEALMAVYGVLVALIVYSGGGASDIMRAKIPDGVFVTWAVVILLAALTLAFGLAKRFRLLMPAGLRLMAITLATFAVAGVALEPTVAETWASAFLLCFIALLAALRSYYLRALTRARFQARREQ